ncbi:tRNA dihydrouridine(20/20a) synthase DusA [Gilvimarinus sp. F26214L]|uniref:tRNA dihydrouridine(20/20a) synthase DusA n=1 Tax=Gilvimarinus sp. DZF01 TaxID=3461371 RepID=UPI004046310A
MSANTSPARARSPATRDETFSRRFCVAPMIDWSDRHCRYLWRLLSRRALLYSEMVTTGALLHGDVPRHLAFHEAEHPVALQLGGSNPAELAACAKLGEQWGYDEINLNCGCPSDRVQSGRFGACLMAEPGLVADCVKAMQDAVAVPVTVKHRIGIDDQDEYADLTRFVDIVAASGCKTFIVHARKAWLQGLSPKENREVPPLNYERVYQLKRDFSELEIIINGGIDTLDAVREHCERVDGAMVGREAYQNPYLLAGVDAYLFGDTGAAPSRRAVLEDYARYCEQQIDQGVALHHMTRHVLGLFHGEKGGKKFRRYISEQVPKNRSDKELLLRAYEAMQS